MAKSKYKQEVHRRMGEKISMRYGTKFAMFIGIGIPLVLNVVYYFYVTNVWGRGYANQHIGEFFILTVLAEVLLLVAFTLYWRYCEIPEEIYGEQEEAYNKQQEIIEQYKREELDIRIFRGQRTNLYTKTFGYEEEDKEYLPVLVLDIINEYDQKIIELEARILHIFQWNEEHSARNEECVEFAIRDRLRWQNGETQIELRPGFPATKLQIALHRPDDYELEFRTEPRHKRRGGLKKEAIYEIEIAFMGKLEGNDSRYKSKTHVAEFYSSPKKGRLNFTDSITSLDDIPKELIRFVAYAEFDINSS